MTGALAAICAALALVDFHLAGGGLLGAVFLVLAALLFLLHVGAFTSNADRRFEARGHHRR